MNNNIILMYHSISRDKKYPYTVTPEDFEKQIIWLKKRGMEITSLENVLSQKTSGECKVVITFDDGYTDNYENALPILEKHGCKATFFIVSHKVGQSNDWEKPYYPRKELMNWEQIKDLVERGHIIGNHTHKHINMLKTSPQDIKESLEKSTTLFQQELGEKTMPFAYPYGAYNNSTVDIVKEFNFTCGVTIFPKGGEYTPHMELGRKDMHMYISMNHFKCFVLSKVHKGYFYKLLVKAYNYATEIKFIVTRSLQVILRNR